MKMDKVAGNKNDEYYTPFYAVEPLLKYVKPDTTVWCPFDTEQSRFVQLFSKTNRVIYSHIDMGQDFFEYMPDEHIDYIISNPPYSLKGKVFERLFEIGIPFAMLVGVVGLFESQHRFNMFKDNPFEIMYLNKRVKFLVDFESGTQPVNPPFSSVYLGYNIFPRQIIFEKLGNESWK